MQNLTFMYSELLMLLHCYLGSTDAHFNSCLTVSAVYLMTSMLAVVSFVDDRGSAYEQIIANDFNSSIENNCEIKEYRIAPSHDSRQNAFSIQSSPSNHSLGDVGLTSQNRQATSNGYNPNAAVLLCTVQAAGWIGVCAQSFFWTSWRLEEVGCIDLALQGVVGIITAALLPLANRYLGAATVWCGSELLFHILMMSVWVVPSSSNAPRVICALTGINYAVHATNGLLVASQLIPDPSMRARTIAMVNNTLPVGQLITAISGGAIAEYFNGFEYVFVCYGGIGIVVTSAVWIYTSKHGLFSNREASVLSDRACKACMLQS